MRISRLAPLILAIVLLLAPSAVFADRTTDLCRFVLLEAAIELNDDTVAVDVAQSRLSAAEQIFELLEGLWRNEALERMVYLDGKHRRDIARLNLQRSRQQLQRRQAIVDQYAAVCGDEAQRSAVAADPVRRFRRADCALRHTDVAIHEVDLAYHRVLLDNVLDLRRNDVATRQDVISAEYETRIAEDRLTSARQLAAQCPAPSAKPGT